MHYLYRNLLPIRLNSASPVVNYRLHYANMSKSRRSNILNNVFIKLGYTLVTRVSHLIRYLEAYTEVTPQRHILSLLQPFVILSNITIAAPFMTRSINIKLKQTGLLTLCITLVWAHWNKNLVHSLKTVPHILYLPLPSCFGSKIGFIFVGPYAEAPIGVHWEVISVF